MCCVSYCSFWANMDAALVGEDTDLLFLLCYYASLDSQNIFLPGPKKNMKKPKVCNIKAVKEQLGPENFQQHPLSACSSWMWYYLTPVWYWKWRFSQVESILSRTSQGVCYRVSYPQGNLHCRKATVILYKGTPGESLDSLCYKHFYEKVSTNTSCIHPQKPATHFSCCKIPQPPSLLPNIGVER